MTPVGSWCSPSPRAHTDIICLSEMQFELGPYLIGGQEVVPFEHDSGIEVGSQHCHLRLVDQLLHGKWGLHDNAL